MGNEQELENKIDRRFRDLKGTGFSSFHSSIHLFLRFLEEREQTNTIVNGLIKNFPGIKDRLALFLNNSSERLALESENEAAAYAYVFFKQIAASEKPPRQLYDRVYFQNDSLQPSLPHQDANDERSLNAVKEILLEPFVRHIIENLSGAIGSDEGLELIDVLTGFYRKECFESTVRLLIDPEAGNPLPISLIYIDLDKFKEVNDKHGHKTGDQVLKQCSSIILRQIQKRGKCYRIGGDEFCVCLINNTAEEAAILAERIRKEIAENSVSDKGLTITGTFGVAEYPRHGDSFDQIEVNVDRALYDAKKCGRNNVRIFGEPKATTISDILNLRRTPKPNGKLVGEQIERIRDDYFEYGWAACPFDETRLRIGETSGGRRTPNLFIRCPKCGLTQVLEGPS